MTRTRIKVIFNVTAVFDYARRRRVLAYMESRTYAEREKSIVGFIIFIVVSLHVIVILLYYTVVIRQFL